MSRRIWPTLIVGIVLFALLASACGQAATPPPEVAPTPSTPEEPTVLKIALANQTSLEQPWNSAFVQALERVKAQRPHDLDLEYQFAENVADPDAERVLREFAATGEYGIIVVHGAYTEALANLSSEFPEIVWVATGGGWDPKLMGGNVYWMMFSLHEPAYLAGIIAGYMSETKTVSGVGGFPFGVVNAPIRAFFAGAKSVDPEIETRMAYIDSWFDPAKAKEFAAAQITAGSDFVYGERYGVFGAAEEGGVYAIGHFVDQHELSPKSVVVSPVVNWDPHINYLIDQWWDHEVNGAPYSAPDKTYINFGMAGGGAELSPFYEFDSVIPAEAKAKVEEVKQGIVDGTFTVPYSEEPIVSD